MKYAKNSNEINHFDPFHFERNVDLLKDRDKGHQATGTGESRSGKGRGRQKLGRRARNERTSNLQ